MHQPCLPVQGLRDRSRVHALDDQDLQDLLNRHIKGPPWARLLQQPSNEKQLVDMRIYENVED